MAKGLLYSWSKVAVVFVLYQICRMAHGLYFYRSVLYCPCWIPHGLEIDGRSHLPPFPIPFCPQKAEGLPCGRSAVTRDLLYGITDVEWHMA